MSQHWVNGWCVWRIYNLYCITCYSQEKGYEIDFFNKNKSLSTLNTCDLCGEKTCEIVRIIQVLWWGHCYIYFAKLNSFGVLYNRYWGHRYIYFTKLNSFGVPYSRYWGHRYIYFTKMNSFSVPYSRYWGHCYIYFAKFNSFSVPYSRYWGHCYLYFARLNSFSVPYSRYYNHKGLERSIAQFHNTMTQLYALSREHQPSNYIQSNENCICALDCWYQGTLCVLLFGILE